MRAALLLLFFIYGGATTVPHNIKWDECDKTALCRVHPSCIEGTQSGDLIDFPSSMTVRKCNIGIHIKPESTTKWTVSIVNDQTEKSKITSWKIVGEVVVCTRNAAEIGEKLKGESVTIANVGFSTPYTLCVFTLTRQSKLTEIFVRLRSADTNPTRQSGLIFDGSATAFDADYYKLDYKYLTCDEKQLFDPIEEGCSDNEDCMEPILGMAVTCPPSYTLVFRKDEKSAFDVAQLICNEGIFKWTKSDSIEPISVGQSRAKCARRKCSVCTPKEQFKDRRNATLTGPCKILTCSGDATFMVITTTSSKQLTSTDAVQCSDNNKVSKDTLKDFPEEEARWVVNEVDEDIQTIECKERIPCDREGQMKIESKCDALEKIERNCTKAPRDGAGAYYCEEGYTLHATLNDTSVSINSPVCENDGTWVISHHLTNESIQMDKSMTEMSIKCYLDAVPKKDAPSSSSSAWIIILVIVIVIAVVAIAVGVYFYLKRKKPKTAASVPTKTSTTSKTSSKPSTSENEPLTSAMVSVTGDSVNTAKPATPVVFAKADVRALTAASSDQSTNKDEKKKVAEKTDKDERTEKTCEVSDGKKDGKKKEEMERVTEKDSYFDESKKQDTRDIASTKESFMKMRTTGEGEEPLQSKTGGDGESQVEKITGESAKLLPKQRERAPRKYSVSKSNVKPKITSNKDFLNVTDSEEDQSRTGSKKPGKKRK